ncbi:putative rhodanese domain-containing protein [Rhypophila decipiens]|uniref:Rhodanese domain-containing protein n=1 Tax=Rhypophila decipiens TaxID=261697 RepID=A0AAN6Y5K2_9PEZI|nr:putative rhodanese domain-containing protein [Rhypophila decipiens]
MVVNCSIARLVAQNLGRNRRITSLSASTSCPIAAARCQQKQISTNVPSSRRRVSAISSAAKVNVTSPQPPASIRTSRRPYSQDAPAAHPAEGESKIWDFDQVKGLASSAGDKSKVILVDAREPQELANEGKIPGAINIPIKSSPDSFYITEDEFEDRFGYPRPPKDAEVVFYCKAGVRSRAAAQLARSAGWTNTGEYPGSWFDWVEKGGKIQR